MLSDIVKVCDSLVEDSQGIVDSASKLPFGRESVILQHEAQKMLDISIKFKEQQLALYDAYIDLLKGSI